jgi:hypothetical protein
MGIDVHYRRIPAAQLQHLVETVDEANAATYMQQDWALFPYSIPHLHVAASSWLHRLLNPTDDPSSILWHVVEGATPLGRNYGNPNQIYLHQVRYLTPQEVQQVAHELVKFDLVVVIDRFALMMEIPHKEPRDILRHPDFARIFRVFEQTLCFFQIAAEVGDGIIRWHSG